MNNWHKWVDKKPTVCEEVLAHDPSWVHEEYNPKGVRIGYRTDDEEFICAEWDNEGDEYTNNYLDVIPTHWQPLPSPPEKEITKEPDGNTPA